MKARQIDEAIRFWKATLGAAAQNLLDVQSHPIYKRISAPDANLSGETASKAATAVRTLPYLLQCFDLLQQAVDKADELRQSMPTLFGTEEREKEITEILEGKSIHLPTVQVPLQQRSLLTSIENVDAIAPADLLAFMQSAFENVKQIVLQLDTAWEKLGSGIEQTAQRAKELLEQSQGLDTADRNALNDAIHRLESVQQIASEDPLGASTGALHEVSETVASVSERIEKLARERRQVEQALATARSLLAKLNEGHERAGAACTEAREKTGFGIDFGIADSKVAALRAWFERLSSTTMGASPSALLVGVRNWTSAAQQAIAAETSVVAEANKQLAMRSELRGRLDALRAKARAYALSEDHELLALAEQAKTLLYSRPTPMSEAAALVSAYEAKLNSQARDRV